MDIKELNEVLKKNQVYKTYLIQDENINRNSFDRNSISFSKAKVLEDKDISDINSSSEEITMDISKTLQALKGQGYCHFAFSVCGGLVIRSDGHKISYVDDLFLYRLIIYPLEDVNGEYKKIPAKSQGIYASKTGKIKKIIHFQDLLTSLEDLELLPEYVDNDYFDILNKGFLSSGKPILFKRVLKKH